MPRDPSGTYTLPLAPVVTDTPIATTWANPTMDDLAQSMTDSLSRSGKGGMTAVMKLVDTTVGDTALSPALQFNSESNSGIYRAAQFDIRHSVASEDMLRLYQDGIGDRFFQFWDGTAFQDILYSGAPLTTILANDTFLQGTDFAGTGVVDIVKVNTSDEIEFGAANVTIPAGDLFIYDTNGLVIGHTAQVQMVGQNSELQVLGDGGNDSSMGVGRFQASASGPTFNFYKSRAATVGGANVTVVTGDVLGTFAFGGDDGVDNNTQAARIRVTAEGTIGTGRVPSKMGFYTGTDAAATVVTLGLEIDSSQDVTIPAGNLGVPNGTLTVGAVAQTAYEFQVVGTSGSPGMATSAGTIANFANDNTCAIQISAGVANDAAIYFSQGTGTRAGRIIYTSANVMNFHTANLVRLSLNASGMTVASLAGAGSRQVFADANGLLSAP